MSASPMSSSAAGPAPSPLFVPTPASMPNSAPWPTHSAGSWSVYENQPAPSPSFPPYHPHANPYHSNSYNYWNDQEKQEWNAAESQYWQEWMQNDDNPNPEGGDGRPHPGWDSGGNGGKYLGERDDGHGTDGGRHPGCPPGADSDRGYYESDDRYGDGYNGGYGGAVTPPGGYGSYHDGATPFDRSDFDNNDDPPLMHQNRPGQWTKNRTKVDEYMSSGGWYAVFAVCLILPALFAWRRRRMARAMRENMADVQNRLAELERGLGDDGDRQRLLAALEKTTVEVKEGHLMDRRSSILDLGSDDILDGDIEMGVIALEQGKRDLDAPKYESASGREGTAPITYAENSLDGGSKDSDEGENETGLLREGGESESALPADGAPRGDGESESALPADGANDKEDATTSTPISGPEDLEIGLVVESNETKLAEESRSREASDDNDASDTSGVVIASVDGPGTSIPAESEPEMTDVVENGFGIDDSPLPAAPQGDPVSSLYVLDEPCENGEGKRYTYLRLPCNDTLPSACCAEAGEKVEQPQPSQHRRVPATCAICLTQYSPGCHVTWSSNPECTHAFHRDCILMWLLKKEEHLCPCCRREFVPESALNVSNDDGVDDVDVDDGVTANDE